ncbi:MAG TPA: hypothetical protein PKO19_07530, partial [Chitinophagales bacterium]|nr:hypothetical protein [Chitinophagales bacterium]
MKFFILGIVALWLLVTGGCRLQPDMGTDGPQIFFDEVPNLIDPAHTKVLIVGVLIYDDPALGNFDTNHRKDEELASAFAAYGIPDSNIMMLQDGEATRNAMYKALSKIAKNSDENTN